MGRLPRTGHHNTNKDPSPIVQIVVTYSPSAPLKSIRPELTDSCIVCLNIVFTYSIQRLDPPASELASVPRFHRETLKSEKHLLKYSRLSTRTQMTTHYREIEFCIIVSVPREPSPSVEPLSSSLVSFFVPEAEKKNVRKSLLCIFVCTR